jgi:hypothetical protein
MGSLSSGVECLQRLYCKARYRAWPAIERRTTHARGTSWRRERVAAANGNPTSARWWSGVGGGTGRAQKNGGSGGGAGFWAALHPENSVWKTEFSWYE